MKPFIIAFFIVIFLVSVSTVALAGENHAPRETYNETNNYTINNYRGVATALANNHSFGWGTDKLQGSLGYSNYDGENALSFGLAQRFKNVLVSGSVGSESNTDKYSFSANMGWRF